MAGIVRTQKAANCISRRHGLGELIPILPLNVFAMFPRKKILGVPGFQGLAVYTDLKGSFMNKLGNHLLNKFEKVQHP